MAQGTEKATFVGSQGDTLAAALDRPDGEPVAFVLFAHCFSCTKDIKAAREIARALRRNGFGVLRFDFTGLGASSGEFGNTNFSSNVEDLVRAADFLREHYQAPSIMIGHSLGGSAVIVAGQRVPEVQGIVTIGAPSEAAHVAHQFGSGRAEIEEKGEAIVQLSGRPFSIKKQFLEDIEGARVRDAAASLKKPLLIMHAPHDETVGIDNASALFVAAKHPKSFVSLDTADHLLRDAKDARYAAETIAAWSSRYLDASGQSVADGPPVGGGKTAPATSGSANTGSPSQASGNTAPAFKGGALAVARSDAGFAADLSIDGYPFTLDAEEAEGGHGLGPNPTRTVEAALAGCAVMTMRMYARRKGWSLDRVEVEVRRAAGKDSHVATELEKDIRLEGAIDDDQRARLVEIADKCPVHRMLSGGVSIKTRLA